MRCFALQHAQSQFGREHVVLFGRHYRFNHRGTARAGQGHDGSSSSCGAKRHGHALGKLGIGESVEKGRADRAALLLIE